MDVPVGDKSAGVEALAFERLMLAVGRGGSNGETKPELLRAGNSEIISEGSTPEVGRSKHSHQHLCL
jgi:hypothetical protein